MTLDQNEDLICEDGVNACEGVETDCCDTIQPSCWTTTQYDPNGDPLVTVCLPNTGCQENYHPSDYMLSLDPKGA